MSDNVAFTPGVGATLATDNIGGVHHQRAKLGVGADGAYADVHETNPLPVEAVASVSTNNSSTATLTAWSTFTGTADDVRDFAAVRVSVFASHDSLPGGLQIQQSQEGTNWDLVQSFSVRAGEPFTVTLAIQGRHVRVLYTNGATNQTAFRLQTSYRPTNPPEPSSLILPQHIAPGVSAPVGGTFHREFYDDFQRADVGPGEYAVGMSPTGQIFTARTLNGFQYADSRITNGRWNLGAVNRTAYYYVYLSGTVRRIGALVRYATGGSGATASAHTLVIGRESVTGSWIHFVCAQNVWQLDVIDELGVFTNLDAEVYAGSITLALDRDYLAQMQVDGRMVTIWLPDGQMRQYEHDGIARYQGNMALYQIYSVATTDHLPLYSAVWADVWHKPGGSAQPDRTAFREGQGWVTPIGGVFNESYGPIPEDNVAATRLTKRGALHVAVADNIPQKPTYRFTARSVSIAAGGTNATKQVLCMWHAASVLKTIVPRKITITVQSVSAATILSLEVVRLTGAPTGGTAITPNPVAGDAASQLSVVSAPTTGGTVALPAIDSQTFNLTTTAANADVTKLQQMVLYEYLAGNDAKPLTIRSGVLEGFAIQWFSTASVTVVVTVGVECTEETP